MYTFWKRSAPPASMDILNAPNRETCAVRRERTNTPLQALRHAQRRAVRRSGPAPGHSGRSKKAARRSTSGSNVLGQRLLSRPFRAEEVPIVRGSLDELLAHYKAHPEDAKKLIAVGESKADASLDPMQLAAGRCWRIS